MGDTRNGSLVEFCARGKIIVGGQLESFFRVAIRIYPFETDHRNITFDAKGDELEV
ncbi:hypothetical protein [Nocardia fluminea]|uniref:hypothetical protein n=1 Tax=Nocardia fluminea TaxID=134984 RepID=UPI003D0A0A90